MELQWLILAAIILSTILRTEIRLNDPARSRVSRRRYRSSLLPESNSNYQIINTLINTLFEKNPREELHSERVAELCLVIGKSLGFSSQQLHELKLTGLLHDIGKIAVDEAILNRPACLNEGEWKSVQRHPTVGYRLLNSVPGMSSIVASVFAHHERWDGTGYPRGLKGEEIPLNARIVAVADAYDAMVSFRPYRKNLTQEQALDELQRKAATQFDPRIIEAFVAGIAREANVMLTAAAGQDAFSIHRSIYSSLVVE